MDHLGLEYLEDLWLAEVLVLVAKSRQNITRPYCLQFYTAIMHFSPIF